VPLKYLCCEQEKSIVRAIRRRERDRRRFMCLSFFSPTFNILKISVKNNEYKEVNGEEWGVKE
jgi:hypothetical protein